MMSVPPPGEKGTIMRTVFDGYALSGADDCASPWMDAMERLAPTSRRVSCAVVMRDFLRYVRLAAEAVAAEPLI
jgi:hypothetical protein